MDALLRVALCLAVGAAGFLGMRAFFWVFYRNSGHSGMAISVCLGAALALLAFAVLSQYMLPESVYVYTSIICYGGALALFLYGMGRLVGFAIKRNG